MVVNCWLDTSDAYLMSSPTKIEFKCEQNGFICFFGRNYVYPHDKKPTVFRLWM